MTKRKDNIVAFPDRDWALSQVDAILERGAELPEINDREVLLMRRAFGLAPASKKMRILLLLGSSRRPSAADTLFTIMIDADQSDEVRRFAAVQLCSLGPGLEIEAILVARLTEELSSPQPMRRANAAIALGWEGHLDCVLDLLELLYDTDAEVQEAAVEALTNLGDPRIVAPFIERLSAAPEAQQKVILYNIERFAAADERVADTYRNYLSHSNPELRLDALSLLGRVSSISEHFEVYAGCMADSDPAVRALALDQLFHQSPGTLSALRPQITALTRDPRAEIRKRAGALLGAIQSSAQES
ncbi:MAG: HEAT repeat domain-containing protein [Desulfosarcinaceae bacterium]|jgi:HEAT repeat protein